jgi:aquaporin Z
VTNESTGFHLDRDERKRIVNFSDPRQEWRRLFAELLGTFFLVLVAAGAGMMDTAFPGSISRSAAVVAPGLMVMAIILFMGKVSGAHLNPAVSFAFALRGDFPWRRVPAYIVVQLAGAALAALILHAVLNVSSLHGSNYPASGYSGAAAMWMEIILTLGLVSVILGTASGAQNVGVLGAFGVGGYIALAGLWASPLSGASMNPARTFGPDLVATNFTYFWAYTVGPIVGAALAVAIAQVLRGRGGDCDSVTAAEGTYGDYRSTPSDRCTDTRFLLPGLVATRDAHGRDAVELRAVQSATSAPPKGSLGKPELGLPKGDV